MQNKYVELDGSFEGASSRFFPSLFAGRFFAALVAGFFLVLFWSLSSFKISSSPSKPKFPSSSSPSSSSSEPPSGKGLWSSSSSFLRFLLGLSLSPFPFLLRFVSAFSPPLCFFSPFLSPTTASGEEDSPEETLGGSRSADDVTPWHGQGKESKNNGNIAQVVRMVRAGSKVVVTFEGLRFGNGSLSK